MLLCVFGYCVATVQLLFCLRGSWGWFPGGFRVPFVVGRVFHAQTLDPPSPLYVAWAYRLTLVFLGIA